MEIVKVIDWIKLKNWSNKDSSWKEAFNTIFWDSIQATKIDEVSIKFDLWINANLLASSTLNWWTISESESKAIISTWINSNWYSLLSSRNNIRYRPWHEIYAYFTASFHNISNNQELNIWLFDSLNWFAVWFKDWIFRIERRYNWTKYTTNRDDFNKDKLDWNWPSWFLLDGSSINIFRISLWYLWISPIVFQIYWWSDLGWITFHIIDLINSSEDLTIESPNLPISCEVKNTGSTVNWYIQSWSWNWWFYNWSYPSRVGDVPHWYSSWLGTNLTGVWNENSVIFRLKTTFNWKLNKTKVKLVHSQFASTATWDIIKVQIIANPTSVWGVAVWSLTYTNIEPDSTVQYKESWGVVVWWTPIFTSYLIGWWSWSWATKWNESVEAEEIWLVWNPWDCFAICYERVTWTWVYKSLCAFNWLELF